MARPACPGCSPGGSMTEHIYGHGTETHVDAVSGVLPATPDNLDTEPPQPRPGADKGDDELTEHQRRVVAASQIRDRERTNDELDLIASCFTCGSNRHHDCRRDDLNSDAQDGDRWGWHVQHNDGWTYRVDRFGGGLYEIVREKLVAAYGDAEAVTRDMARLANGDVPVECSSCGGNGMVAYGPPGRDCPNCECGTIWAKAGGSDAE